MSQLLVNPDVAQASITWQQLAGMIDHTLLGPSASANDVIRHCQEATECSCAAVFVSPHWTALALSLLRGTAVKVGVPVGLPAGASFTSVKRYAAEEALRVGASEIDMVMNVGALRSGDRHSVAADILGVAEVVHSNGGILKVILETSLLTLEEKILASHICADSGADFVKSCTGLTGGAHAEDIALMRGVVGEKIGVKASGGIRTASAAMAMVQAGANRIGTSATLDILREFGAPVSSPASLDKY
jgi:deoxyribose-phosphate aldolase